ncbi:C4-dicarboxylic acid transporter DauA [Botrimarina colliarenosi]|uniref:C4-dicarboxylic acid transporter DauA n=1 Tax=Botrimarina colliarenosi TaxID=2528001 RepID=A0A5C6AEV9_9BACT|nr:SulP family inorganic anion transporter [Botrimarina colliarenosi]TWT97960.1 C4-dicarboxylic acid transporter DauA [Botrimarina colliarenosi]
MSNPAAPRTTTNEPAPVGNAEGFTRYLRHDLLSGFLVFLIALPLCLGISLASGYPALAGIFTAIIGALVTTFISNSELTIKGPAAGLIVIAIGCINDFGGDGVIGGFTDIDHSAYQAALAVGVAAAVLQICFAIFRAGILGEFFPTAAVHGMLAAIGVIIMIKQIPTALGVTAKGEPLEMLKQIPHYVAEANPAIAAIGLVSIGIMFLWPVLKKRVPALNAIPAPIVVLLVSVAMGMGFDLLHEHSYTLSNHKYQLGEQYLVNMPDKVFGMFDQITYPDFGALTYPKAWKWIFMFFAIGSLESLLSSKAVDLLDPWKRKTDMNRDMLAVGVANLAAAGVGGLPMISEIVRSKANIDNGARTRFADLWHGVFLLLCVALIPTILHRIPLAALAAMLVYTGFRLAHPNEFVNAYRIGKEQLVIFVTTIVAVLATDLLMGIGIGILTKMVIHLANGVPLSTMFKPFIEVEEVDANASMIIARGSAVFSNWIPFRRQIEQIGLIQRRNIIIDVSHAKLVDHSVMEKLEQMQADFVQEGLGFEVRGLDTLQPYTSDPYAARKRAWYNASKLCVLADTEVAERLRDDIVSLVATSSGDATTFFTPSWDQSHSGVRIEVIGPRALCDAVAELIRSEASLDMAPVAWVEPVESMRLTPSRSGHREADLSLTKH